MSKIFRQEQISRICEAIQEIEKDYQSVQGLILSEDDLKCLIYQRLYNLFQIHHEKTQDQGILASPLHSEIKFLDRKQNLTIRPDITILQPKNLSIAYSSDNINIGRKGFVFGGSTVVIEIKFCKARSGITDKQVLTFRKDCEKIIDLRNSLYSKDHQSDLYGIVVIFNKTNKKCQNFQAFLEEYQEVENLDIIYGTGNFVFPRSNCSPN